MSATSNSFKPKTSEGSRNATSSQGSLFGPTHSDLPAGGTTGSAGREAVPARPSVPPEKAQGLEMLVISGRIGFNSSASFALQRSLGNRLRQRLDTAGSTLFKLTWREPITPLGRRYLERAVSVRRTSGRDCTSVPTPCAQHAEGSPEAFLERKRRAVEHGSQMGISPTDLQIIAKLSTVPTPCTPNGGRSMDPEKMDATGRTADGRKHAASLEHAVKLAAVPTPQEGDRRCGQAKRAIEGAHAQRLTDYAHLSSVPTPTSTERSGQGEANSSLMQEAKLASLSTPSARDWKAGSYLQNFKKRTCQLDDQVLLVASGQTVTGGTRETANIGQLNPEYSRWLMGLPTVFSSCADLAMQSLRRSPKRSSKR